MMPLCAPVRALPIGANPGGLHRLWLLASGLLLDSRGAVIPGAACVWPARSREPAGLGDGGAGRPDERVVSHGGRRRWPARGAGSRTRGGYRPTTDYHGEAGKALPAIPIDPIARVGSTVGQRLALPLACVRADGTDPSPAAHARLLVREAVRLCAPDDALVLDAGFGLALLQGAGAPR